MAASALLLEFVVCFFVSLYLLNKYGDLRRQNVFSSIATFVAWYVSFLLVFTLPIDIASTYYNQCIKDNSPIIPVVNPNDTSSTVVPFSNASILVSTLPPLSSSSSSPSSSSSSSSQSIPSSDDLSPADNAYTNPTSTGDALNVHDAASSTPSSSSSSSVSPFSSVINCHQPWTYSPEGTLRNIFRLVYWTSQLLTWIVLPLMQSYAWAGDFSIAGKLRSAIIYNAIYYGSYLLIFGVLLIYVASRIDLTASYLKVICITASNTWGLFLLVLLLGYGLVDIPRVLWNSCNRNLALAQTHFKIAKLSTDKSEAEEEMEDCLEEVRRAAETITYNHPHRRFIEIILSKCPEATRENIRPCTMDDFQDYEDDGAPKKRMDVPSEKTLVRLHVRVIRAMQAYNRTQAQWEMLIDRALALEDEVRNIAATHRSFTKSSATAKGDTSTSNFGFLSRVFDSVIYTPTVEWYWRCLIRPNLLRLVAICFAVLSMIVVWSEVTFFARSPVLSLFAVFLQAASITNSGMVVFLSGITISYLCLCAYYTIFRIKIFNYYYIASDHLTDENSLLFIGALLCRLTPPLCLNFLGLIHLDSHVTHLSEKVDPSYSHIMGHLHVIPVIEDGFNIYFPILVVVLCLATHFHVGSRCLAFLGFQQFIGDDEMTQDYVDDGRNLLNREKRHRERAGGPSSRRHRLGAYRPAASSERDTLDLRGGVESRSGVTSGGAFSSSRSRGVKNNDGVVDESANGDADDFLGHTPSADSPVSLTGGIGGGRGRSGVGYQSGLPSNRGNGGRSNIRGIFDDV